MTSLCTCSRCNLCTAHVSVFSFQEPSGRWSIISDSVIYFTITTQHCVGANFDQKGNFGIHPRYSNMRVVPASTSVHWEEETLLHGGGDCRNISPVKVGCSRPTGIPHELCNIHRRLLRSFSTPRTSLETH